MPNRLMDLEMKAQSIWREEQVGPRVTVEEKKDHMGGRVVGGFMFTEMNYRSRREGEHDTI